MGGFLKESFRCAHKYLSALLSNRDLQGRIVPIAEEELARRAGISRKTAEELTKRFVKAGIIDVSYEPNLKSRVKKIIPKDQEFLERLARLTSQFR